MAILPPPDVQIPPSPGRPGGWGDKLETSLVRFVGRLLNAAKDALAGVIRFGFETFLEAIEPNLIEMTAPIFSLLEDQEDVPPELRSLLDKVKSGEHQVGSLLLQSLGGSAIGAITGNLIGTMLAKPTYALNRRVQPARLDFGTLWRSRNRGGSPANLFLDDLADQGWSGDRIGLADLAAEVRPGIAEIVTLWLRREIDEPTFRQRLIQEGVPADNIADVIALSQAMPSPGDLVRFALREVWRDELRPELLSPNAPGRYYELMAQQGYSSEFAADYWAAHWELPSALMGFQMLHRLADFTEADLKALLTRLDILPAYHDNIIKIAYQEYTRVDARRMYSMGIISEDEVLASYRAQGYDETKARNMTNFAVMDALESDRQLTKSDITRSYEVGAITNAEAVDMLAGIGFSANAAGFILSRADFAREQKLVRRQTALVGDLYVSGDLNVPQVSQRLAELGLAAANIQMSLAEWDVDRTVKTRKPSRATLEKMYKSGAIALDDFTATMTQIGYQAQYIDWYLRNITIEKLAEAGKEEERARKEAQRIAKDKARTAYQTTKASIDVDIAEVRAAIVASQLALVELQNERAARLRSVLSESERAELEYEYMTAIHESDAAIEVAGIEVGSLRSEVAGLRTRIAEIAQSLSLNVDVARNTALQAEKSSLLIEVRRLEKQVAAAEVFIRQIKEVIEANDHETLIADGKADILSLQTDQAAYREGIAAVRVRVSEIDAEIKEALQPEARATLETERRGVGLGISELQVEISQLQEQIGATEDAKSEAKRALERGLSALPGREDSAAIRESFDTRIEAIKRQIRDYEVNLSELRVGKAQLQVSYRKAIG